MAVIAQPEVISSNQPDQAHPVETEQPAFTERITTGITSLLETTRQRWGKNAQCGKPTTADRPGNLGIYFSQDVTYSYPHARQLHDDSDINDMDGDDLDSFVADEPIYAIRTTSRTVDLEEVDLSSYHTVTIKVSDKVFDRPTVQRALSIQVQRTSDGLFFPRQIKIFLDGTHDIFRDVLEVIPDPANPNRFQVKYADDLLWRHQDASQSLLPPPDNFPDSLGGLTFLSGQSPKPDQRNTSETYLTTVDLSSPESLVEFLGIPKLFDSLDSERERTHTTPDDLLSEGTEDQTVTVRSQVSPWRKLWEVLNSRVDHRYRDRFKRDKRRKKAAA